MADALTVTDRQWEKWGAENPYFGVLLVDTAAIEDPATRARFFASGERHVADLLSAVEERIGPISRGAALDFGCGVGRLVLPLSRRFEEVCGVDVSASMLEVARGNLKDAGNVTLARTPGALLTTGRTFDFVHSYIVFQHIRPEQGMPLLRQLVSLLKPGGAFALHVTVGDSRRWRSRLNRLRYRIGPVHWAYNLVRRRKWNESITEMNRYDLGEILRLLDPMIDGGVWVNHIDENGYNGVLLSGRRK